MKKVILLLSLIAGCQQPEVETNRTTFYDGNFLSLTHSTISIEPINGQNTNSLEYRNYKDKLKSKLETVGYTVLESKEKVDYLVYFTYGIDDGKSEIVSTPILGQTSGGTTITSGNIYTNRGNIPFSSNTYSMPTYGVVGTVNNSVTTYSRAIAIDIVPNKPNRKSIYEVRAKSVGTCKTINGVMDEMLDAIFKDFPGKNGETIDINIPYKGTC